MNRYQVLLLNYIKFDHLRFSAPHFSGPFHKANFDESYQNIGYRWIPVFLRAKYTKKEMMSRNVTVTDAVVISMSLCATSLS